MQVKRQERMLLEHGQTARKTHSNLTAVLSDIQAKMGWCPSTEWRWAWCPGRLLWLDLLPSLPPSGAVTCVAMVTSGQRLSAGGGEGGGMTTNMADRSKTAETGSDTGIDDVITGNLSKYAVVPPAYLGQPKKGHLVFDACFESGNLGRVDHITEFEYDLFIRPDTCNQRFRVWFNFTVENVKESQQEHCAPESHNSHQSHLETHPEPESHHLETASQNPQTASQNPHQSHTKAESQQLLF
uniref:Cytosolic carboxypeptidase N-terminal domain-containing protein n=1 Tax=Anolis carolinensis TaxID=28377 RepID=A0A803TQ19_ANOCA